MEQTTLPCQFMITSQGEQFAITGAPDWLASPFQVQQMWMPMAPMSAQFFAHASPPTTMLNEAGGGIGTFVPQTPMHTVAAHCPGSSSGGLFVPAYSTQMATYSTSVEPGMVAPSAGLFLPAFPAQASTCPASQPSGVLFPAFPPTSTQLLPNGLGSALQTLCPSFPALPPQSSTQAPAAPTATPQAAVPAAEKQREADVCSSGSDAATVPPAGSPIAGELWSLCRDAEGCRLVQETFEGISSDSQREALAAEMRGHVWAASQCPHANHVLQKMIMTMKAESVQFIVDEIMRKGAAATCKAARNQYGCRIIQRLLEQCFPHQMHGLVDDLMTDRARLCTHIYGNYVMRHVLEYGPAEARHQLALHIQQHALELGSDEKGCAVLGKALAHTEACDQKAIAQAILAPRGLLAALSCKRHGHVATETLLKVVEAAEREEAVDQLTKALPALGTSRFGRSVIKCLQQLTNTSANAPGR